MPNSKQQLTLNIPVVQVTSFDAPSPTFQFSVTPSCSPELQPSYFTYSPTAEPGISPNQLSALNMYRDSNLLSISPTSSPSASPTLTATSLPSSTASSPYLLPHQYALSSIPFLSLADSAFSEGNTSETDLAAGYASLRLLDESLCPSGSDISDSSENGVWQPSPDSFIYSPQEGTVYPPEQGITYPNYYAEQSTGFYVDSGSVYADHGDVYSQRNPLYHPSDSGIYSESFGHYSTLDLNLPTPVQTPHMFGSVTSSPIQHLTTEHVLEYEGHKHVMVSQIPLGPHPSLGLHSLQMPEQPMYQPIYQPQISDITSPDLFLDTSFQYFTQHSLDPNALHITSPESYPEKIASVSPTNQDISSPDISSQSQRSRSLSPIPSIVKTEVRRSSTTDITKKQSSFMCPFVELGKCNHVKPFNRLHNLKVHMSVHEDERVREFECLCGKSYFRVNELRRHQKKCEFANDEDACS